MGCLNSLMEKQIESTLGQEEIKRKTLSSNRHLEPPGILEGVDGALVLTNKQLWFKQGIFFSKPARSIPLTHICQVKKYKRLVGHSYLKICYYKCTSSNEFGGTYTFEVKTVYYSVHGREEVDLWFTDILEEIHQVRRNLGMVPETIGGMSVEIGATTLQAMLQGRSATCPSSYQSSQLVATDFNDGLTEAEAAFMFPNDPGSETIRPNRTEEPPPSYEQAVRD